MIKVTQEDVYVTFINAVKLDQSPFITYIAKEEPILTLSFREFP